MHLVPLETTFISCYVLVNILSLDLPKMAFKVELGNFPNMGKLKYETVTRIRAKL
jgi:hypothetical protein